MAKGIPMHKKQRNFGSVGEAIKYCTSKGKLEYHG
jgi:hypothetical protein